MRHAMGLIGILAVAVTAAGIGRAEPEPGPLDGRTFEVTLVEKGKSDPQPDTLIFNDGSFDSAGCREYGFTAASYKATQKGDAWTFVVETKSAEEGTNRWEGTIRDSAIEGTLVWTKPGQEPISYTFKSNPKK